MLKSEHAVRYLNLRRLNLNQVKPVSWAMSSLRACFLTDPQFRSSSQVLTVTDMAAEENPLHMHLFMFI